MISSDFSSNVTVLVPGTSRRIGGGCSSFIIAEAGVNHNGDMRLARRLVDAAVRSGADAVKFQTFQTERVVSRTAPRADYQRRGTDSEQTQYALLKPLELSWDNHLVLRDYCREQGILFLSTPHDEGAIEVLDRLEVPVFKVGSGDVTNLSYLRRMAGLGRPIILSTGMSTLGEVEEAVFTIFNAGNRQLVLLHCVSNYPAAIEDCNLRVMAALRAAFHVPVGFSDHTLGFEVALAAVALGACVIEKHLTIDKSLPGPDHQASLEPEEFQSMVEGIRRIEGALGDGLKRPTLPERNTIEVARKSVVAVVSIPAGTVISREMLAIKRPGTGISPRFIDRVVGRQARELITEDQVLDWEAIG